MTSELNRFNIRVYGLLINEQNEILLIHEKIRDFAFTKFPGGGLELGEGMIDCLVREFKEEAELDVEVTEHFYTTDFFQQSAFKKSDQLISVYYKIRPLQPTSGIRLDSFTIEDNGALEQLQFFWVKLDELQESMLTFPIDKHVCRLLQQ
jgi:8-oxo-dGTP diphosphatase